MAVTDFPLLTDGSEPMGAVLRELARVAPSRLPILVVGPTGCGKELAARELHARSGRNGPLVALNCSAFSESLMESEVFGHVRGAFTGALKDHVGAIEAAEGGTLFLDEVAELSPRLQAVFLRILQEREVRRVGGSGSRQVDVRFVAATHRSLEALAEAGRFRWDLLFRLQGSVLALPGLDARRHEFGFLVPRLVAGLASEAGREAPALAPGLAQALGERAWPGNVRELRHCLERALLRCAGDVLTGDHVPELQAAPEPQGWVEATRRFQRDLLRETLLRHGFRMAEAARALGMARPALYAAAKRLGVPLRECSDSP